MEKRSILNRVFGVLRNTFYENSATLISRQHILTELLEVRQMCYITFNVSFTSGFTSRMPDVSAAEAAFTYATKELNGLTSKSITINLQVSAVSGTTTLSESQSNLAGPVTFSSLRSALLAQDSSLQFATSDPISGTHQWYLTQANAKMLGYTVSSPATYDGTVTFGAGQSWNFSTTNRAVAGEYDFVGAADHEISEVMGRIAGLGANVGGVPTYFPLDLFRVTSSDIHTYNAATAAYFSTTGSAGNAMFNQDPSGDYGDWHFYAPLLVDGCDAFVNSGEVLPFSGLDVSVMNALGYD